MQQNVIENEFNSEYAPLATIQPGMAIEFTVKGANDLYLDLNNSRLHMIDKITTADRTNIDTNTAAPINLTLHSMFRKIGMEFNGRNVGDTSQLYPYRSVLKSLLNFYKEVQETQTRLHEYFTLSLVPVLSRRSTWQWDTIRSRCILTTERKLRSARRSDFLNTQLCRLDSRRHPPPSCAWWQLFSAECFKVLASRIWTTLSYLAARIINISSVLIWHLNVSKTPI